MNQFSYYTVRIGPRRALAGDCVKTPFGSTPVPGHRHKDDDALPSFPQPPFPPPDTPANLSD